MNICELDHENWLFFAIQNYNNPSSVTYSDFTTATLTYASLGGDTLDGQNYRVKINSAGGTEEVITNGAATLTFSS